MIPGDGDGAEDRPRIQAGTGPVTIRAISEAMNAGRIGQVYVSAGQPVRVEQVSGTAGAVAGDEDSPLPVTASVLTPPGLARLLADQTFTFRRRNLKGGQETFDEEVTPSLAELGAVLAAKTWPGLPTLAGIIGAPVLRPDGTLLQEPGYDEKTGLYLASKVPLERVPAEPGRRLVSAARSFLLDRFLSDFPWKGDPDRANYCALLVTPVLGNYLRTLVPFAVVTSTMPGSGKTILTCGLGMLYGQRMLTWTRDDNELRKAITSVLADPVGTVIFDNLVEGTVIDSPVLARLITERTWADRLLGQNTTVTRPNDRVWCATGNNLRLGGDMRTRSVLVGLDPNMPRPEERTGFTIPDLDQWILSPANQREILWHLLILVTDWIGAGAPRGAGLTMRQFTPWAEALGGFLAHHGIGGFLGNTETVRDIDDDDATWAAFLGRWHALAHDGTIPGRVSSHALRLSADIPYGGLDPWDGLFLSEGRGRSLSAKSIGKLLAGQIDRFHGSYALRSDMDPRTKVRIWWVDEWAG